MTITNRVRLFVEVDKAFRDFRLETNPSELRDMGKAYPGPVQPDLDKRLRFLDRIDAMIPDSALHNNAHHKYVIGRESGRRFIFVTVNQVHLGKDFDFAALYKESQEIADEIKAKFTIQDDGLQKTIQFWFDH
jgi:hypothetical protein